MVKNRIHTTESFKKQAKENHLLEYWEATYRKTYPDTDALPHIWKWDQMKDLLNQTTDFIGIDEAARRGLILVNPGLTGPFITPTMFSDIQLLNPGERAPVHRHTSSASRLIMEGTGGYTVVEGEKCYMAPGDFILNPRWDWHDHGNEGDEQVIYLNVLDIPLVEQLGSIFYDFDYKKENDLEEHFQSEKKPTNASEKLFRSGGLYPQLFPRSGTHQKSPQLIYKWDWARHCLEAMKDYEGDPYEGLMLEYTNPATGGPVLETMSFRLQLLRPGQHLRKHRHTTSTVYWAVEGQGFCEVSGEILEWEKNDVFALPSWKWHRLANTSQQNDAALLSVSDEPAVRAFGLYREEAEDSTGDFVRIEWE